MRELRSRWLRTAAIGFWMTLAWGGALAAQEDVAPAELREALEERFEVRMLRGGVLFEPREPGEGPRSIEVGEDGVALDGAPVADDELAARLGGPTARLLRAASALPVEELRALFLAPLDEAAASEVEAEAEDGEEESEAIVADEEEEGDGEERRRVRRDTQVVVGDSLVVEENEVSDDVVVVGGTLEVLGEVRGDAVVVGGSLEVSGEVTGDVAAIGGSVELVDGARVGGDAVAVGGSVERGENVEIGGKIVETPFGPKVALGPWLKGWKDHELEFRPWERWMKVGWKFFWAVFLSLLACLALLVARRPVERMERRVESEPWKSGLVGLLAQALFLPLLILVVVVLCVSIIGIPLLLLLPFAIFGLFVAGFFGFVAVARRVGLALEARFGGATGSPYLQAMAGIAVIYAGSLIGHLINTGPFPLRAVAVMILILGTFIWYAAWTVGFGASLLTRFGTAEGWQRAAAVPPPPPPAPAEREPPADTGWADDEVERS
jgi:hypothetical protein